MGCRVIQCSQFDEEGECKRILRIEGKEKETWKETRKDTPYDCIGESGRGVEVTPLGIWCGLWF